MNCLQSKKPDEREPAPARDFSVFVENLDHAEPGGSTDSFTVPVKKGTLRTPPMGYLRLMKEVVRVPTAKFKQNVRRFVALAKSGATVLVTNNGVDDFQVVSCQPGGVPAVADTGIDPALYRGIDMNAPAFTSWEGTGAS